MIFLAMTLQWLCSGLRVYLKIQTKLRNYSNKSKVMVHYQIAAGGVTGGWLHDQFANRVKKRKNKVIALLCSFINVLE